ncbi:MAG: hypothetical protein A2Y36_17245 [Treponema sp. GWA1_62_8]|nr:MAG: hypothetical protein A2Y36_17245 [Treponema sp. GWA1_62_8]
MEDVRRVERPEEAQHLLQRLAVFGNGKGAFAAEALVGFGKQFPGIAEEACGVRDREILDVRVREGDGPPDHRFQLVSLKVQSGRPAGVLQSLLQRIAAGEALGVGSQEGDARFDTDGDRETVLAGDVVFAQLLHAQGAEEFVGSGIGGQLHALAEAEYPHAILECGIRGSLSGGTLSGVTLVSGSRTRGLFVAAQVQAVRAAIHVAFQQGSHVGRETVVDLVIDEVVEDGRQGGDAVRAFQETEDVFQGMELPGLVGHDPVHHHRDTLQVGASAIETQGFGRLDQYGYQFVQHSMYHSGLRYPIVSDISPLGANSSILRPEDS